jgi:hypothetical protein
MKLPDSNNKLNLAVQIYLIHGSYNDTVELLFFQMFNFGFLVHIMTLFHLQLLYGI